MSSATDADKSSLADEVTAQPAVVVFACGNLSRGDDALGPLLLQRLYAWLTQEGLAGNFVLIYDYQLQIEHALDLQGRCLALFIDAGFNTVAPFHFYRAQADTSVAYSSHRLTPEAVLGVWQRVEQTPPPPGFVLCVAGESFELGEEIGPMANANLDAAFDFLCELCRDADVAVWQERSATTSQ